MHAHTIQENNLTHTK